MRFSNLKEGSCAMPGQVSKTSSTLQSPRQLIEKNGKTYTLGQHDRCRVATLLGLLMLRRPVMVSHACKCAISHCTNVRMTHELQRAHLGGNRCADGALSNLCPRASKQYIGFVGEGCPIAMHAEAGRTRGRWPLVLPSHMGKLIAPDGLDARAVI